MSTKVMNHLDLGNVSRIENLGAPIQDNDAARKIDISSAMEGIAWKDSVVVSTQSNLDLSSPGATIDGITMSNSDRVLVRAQTAGNENGIYVWNSSSTAMSRAVDASSTKLLEQAVLSIEEGTNAGVTYRQTQVNFTIDVDDVLFTQFGSAVGAASETESGVAELATQAETDAGMDDARFITPLKLKTSPLTVKKYSAAFGDGSAMIYEVTHSANSFDVFVKVYRNSAPYDEIMCEVRFKTRNSIELHFNVAPTANEFKVAVIG